MFLKTKQDIAELEADIIVNPLSAGKDIDKPGRWFKPILSCCSDPEALLMQVKAHGENLPFGSSFFTSAYGLHAKKILHVIVPYEHFDPSANQLQKCIQDALEKAIDKGRRVVFPLLGTGDHGYPDSIADHIFRRVAFPFLEQHPEMDIYLNLQNESKPLDLNRILPNPHAGDDAPKQDDFLFSVGAVPGESFASLFRRIIFHHVGISPRKRKEALSNAWNNVNTLVGLYKARQADKLGFMIRSIALAKREGKPLPYVKGVKSSHAPEYEWKTVKTKDGKAVWQRPTRAELLLAGLVLPINKDALLSLYGFCGYSLTEFEVVDNVFRLAAGLLEYDDPWSAIVITFKKNTGLSIYDVKEERKKIYVAEADRF